MMCRLRYTSEIWSVLTYHRKQLKHCRVCGYNVLVFICPHYGFDSHIAGIELAMDDVRSQNAQQCVVIVRTNSNIFYGKVSEWFMVMVLKTVAQRCAVGSNPILSAIWRDGRVAYYTSLLRKSGYILPPWVQIPLSPPI